MSDFLERISNLSPKRLALLAAELQERLEQAESGRREPIAVVGLGCRFPGADSPEEFWRLLQDGVDAIREVPSERWDVDSLFDPDPEAPGKLSSRWGGFLSRIDLFDPALFGISPREASSLDPQQRLLLEVAWEALENAGQAPDGLRDSQTGVFVGVCNSDYYQILARGGLESVDAYRASGNANSVISGRVSYVLGLRGPAISVDTACSSSLVALHLACQSVASGECRAALAGGVNVLCSPETTVALSRAKMMAPDGRCKAFDSRADGFVRAEGCGVVVLKRLADAEEDGDRVLALIRGTAANQDGRSSGITAPNGPSQEAVIRAALANAAVEPSEVDFVEAHGTGTSLGDPIEARALGAVLGTGRDPARPALVGSVKTNIGHAESAAGIAGLIKLILALQHAQIPPHLHLETPNPHVDWPSLPLRIPTEPVAWEPGEKRRIGGVSSFGFSGTNVHVVVEEAPPTRAASTSVERPLHLLTLSGGTEAALAAAARRLGVHLETHPDDALGDVAFSANVGRAQLAWRAAVIAATTGEARERLEALPGGGDERGVMLAQAKPGEPPRVAFLFPGQGPQYAGMGRQLFETQAVFRRALLRCEELLRPHLDRSLTSLLHPEAESEGLLDQTRYTQPAMFALQWALSEMWRSWGVEPTAVLGHSAGEYAAACVAGVLSLEDGIALIAERGRLMQALPPGGEMISLLASEARAAEAIDPLDGRVSVAAINGSESVVISGETAAVREVAARMEKEGVKTKRLAVSQAGHSALLDPMLAGLECAAREAAHSDPRIDFISNLTGRVATTGQIGPEYWPRQARQPVRFADAMAELRRLGYSAFVEMGPHPVLLGMGRECLGIGYGVWAPSLRREEDDWETLLGGIGTLWTHGVDVTWSAFDRGHARRKLALPTYPFQRQRYWADLSSSRASANEQSRPVGHPLLGRRLRAAVPTFEARLEARQLPILSEHRLFGVPVAAASVLIEMALAAVEVGRGWDSVRLEGLELREALSFDDDGVRTVQVTCSPGEEGTTVSIHSLASERDGDDPEWTLHAVADVKPAEKEVDLSSPPTDRHEDVDEATVDRFRQALGARGIELGESFQGLHRLWRGDSEALGLVRPGEGTRDVWRAHPAVLDACLQVLGAAVPGEWDDEQADTYLLAGCERAWIGSLEATDLWSHARVRPAEGDGEGLRGDVSVVDGAGRTRAELTGLVLKRLAPAAIRRAATDRRQSGWLHEVHWPERPLPGPRLPRPAAEGRPTALAIARFVRPHLEREAEEHELALFDEALPKLDRLARSFVHRALGEDLGWRPAAGERVSVAALADELGVVPEHRRLLGRMLEVLAEDGTLRRVEGGWEAAGPLPTSGDPSALVQEIRSQQPGCEAQLELLGRCGPHLAGAMRGQQDPLQLLFEGGSFDTAEHLYERTSYARVFNGALREAAAAVVGALPEDRTLRVLEIGAGTGASTSAILPELPPERAEYVFTDVSRLFLSRAEEKFHDYSFVRYSLYDAERSPAAQGLTPGRFDVVVAANVLHATRRLEETLAHARELLAPGGLLVLLEGTQPHLWVDVTFGLTEGWWRFEDADIRPSHPLLDAARWSELLSRVGFEGPIPISATNGAEQTLVLAQAPRVEAAPKRPAAIASRCWMVLGGESPTGRAVVAEIRGAGGRVVSVERGGVFSEGDGELTLDPTQEDQLARAVAVGRRAADGLPLVALHLWGHDLEVAENQDPEAVVAAQVRVQMDLTRVVRALGTGGGAQLWVATRGAQRVSERSVSSPPQATLWGLSRVVALERPELWGGIVDLDPESGAGDALALVDEIAGSTGEDQVAFRGGTRHVARLRRAREPGGAPATWSADGSYLITGGLGGLGLGLARWLVDQGVRHIVITSRRGLPELAESGALPDGEIAGSVEAIRGLEALGATIEVVRAHVADVGAMTRLVEGLASASRPLRGVFHLAADIQPATLDELDEERLTAMLRPKVGGAWLLNRLTRDLDLHAFVLFSSTTSILGVAGLAHYAAANQFLDGLATWRHARGLPALAVDWGIWEVMRRASDAAQKQFLRSGLIPLPLNPALDLMGRLVGDEAPQAIVAAVDWNVLKTVYESRRRRPLLEAMGGAAPVHAEPSPSKAITATDLPRRFREAPVSRREEVVVAHVRREVGHILGLDSAAVDPEQGLFEMGMDSLMSVELKGRLEAAVGTTLPSTLTFNHPNAGALAGFLIDEVLEPGPEAPAREKPGEAAAPPDEDDDDLSEDELAERLAARLKESAGR